MTDKRYRGFKPILDYRPPSRSKKPTDSERVRDLHDDDRAEENEPKGRGKGRSKMTYEEEEEHETRSNEGRLKGSSRSPKTRRRPPMKSMQPEETEYEETAEERPVRGRSRTSDKSASFDYDDDLDDPYADRLKSSRSTGDDGGGLLSSAPTSGPMDDSQSNSSRSEDKESEVDKAEDGKKPQSRSDSDSTILSSEKREMTTSGGQDQQRRNGKSVGMARKARQLSSKRSAKRLGSAKLAEQTVGLLDVDREEEGMDDEGDDDDLLDDHVGFGQMTKKSDKEREVSRGGAKDDRLRPGKAARRSVWSVFKDPMPDSFARFGLKDHHLGESNGLNSKVGDKAAKCNKTTERRTLFDRVYDQDNTDSTGQYKHH
jgi:hypothetical protein